MKKLFLISMIFLTRYAAQAQVAVGKQSLDGGAILDFATGGTSGIILPTVSSLPSGSGATDGTLIINAVNANAVKAQARTNGAWIDISDDARNITTLNLNATAEQGTIAIIGASSSNASGVLVLEAIDKALVLPKVANAEADIKSPFIGTMVYDLSSKSLAIFDGAKWNFWK